MAIDKAAAKAVSGGNAVAKKKARGKPFTAADAATRGKPFVAGDARANRHGQRNREAVASAAQARAIYVARLNEPPGTGADTDATHLELIIRSHLDAALAGDPAERERLFDRVFGRVSNTLDIELQATCRAIPVEDLTDAELTQILARHERMAADGH